MNDGNVLDQWPNKIDILMGMISLDSSAIHKVKGEENYYAESLTWMVVDAFCRRNGQGRAGCASRFWGLSCPRPPLFDPHRVTAL